MIGEDEVMAALRNVYDPETGLTVVDLGLIYGVAVQPASGNVEVSMTFTTPACPAGGAMREGVDRALRALPGVTGVDVQVIFEPPWTPERISADGRAQLGC